MGIMIILIGTKGQLIKMIPVMQEMANRDLYFNYFTTDQHPSMNKKLEQHFGLCFARTLRRDVSYNDAETPMQLIRLFIDCFYTVWSFSNHLGLNRWWRKQKLIITHGDTATTLFACLVAKLFGKKLAHIESGLRSYSILHPFPEELIRRIACRCADYLFAPGDWAVGNLKYVRGKVINTRQNTVYDLLKQIPIHKSGEKYVVFTCHRQETIYNYHRLAKVVALAHRLAEKFTVNYILHATSEHQLRQYNLYYGLLRAGIKLLPYQDYVSFMSMVAGAEFVVTDGGGLQEETYYLDIPCLLLRDRTERKVGLGKTAILSEMDDATINWFLENYRVLHRHGGFTDHEPSKIIVDWLEKIAKENNELNQ